MTLAYKGNIYNICNTGTKEMPGIKNIYSPEDLEATKEIDDTIYLLNVHLNWKGNKLSNNVGFDIANEMRTKIKAKAPIIFYSPLPTSYFEERSKRERKYRILYGRGSAFIEIPFVKSHLSKLIQELRPLSNAALHDVVTMLCDLKGIVIERVNHDLKFGGDIDKVIKAIRPYLNQEQIVRIGLDEFVKNIEKQEDETSFNSVKLQFITLCNQQLSEGGDGTTFKAEVKYRILVLDDVPEEITKAKNNLSDGFIIEDAKTGQQAIEILERDVNNEIVAVITDWRLFTDARQDYWQPIQGYEVLNFSAGNGIRSLFALTSQAEFVVHQIRNLMGIRFSMFKKENLTNEDQWKVFAGVLYEACEQATNLRCAIPQSDNWKKTKSKKKSGQYFTSLNGQYIACWNSGARDEYFNNVDIKSNEIWEYLMNERKNGNRGLYSLKDKYGLRISADPVLYPVLVYRRIWMALWYLTIGDARPTKDMITHTRQYCFEMMFTGGNSSYEGNGPNTEMNKLCLLQNEIQAKIMLPEEKDWLTRKSLI